MYGDVSVDEWIATENGQQRTTDSVRVGLRAKNCSTQTLQYYGLAVIVAALGGSLPNRPTLRLHIRFGTPKLTSIYRIHSIMTDAEELSNCKLDLV
jgi:hypothetical protein